MRTFTINLLWWCCLMLHYLVCFCCFVRKNSRQKQRRCSSWSLSSVQGQKYCSLLMFLTFIFFSSYISFLDWFWARNNCITYAMFLPRRLTSVQMNTSAFSFLAHIHSSAQVLFESKYFLVEYHFEISMK